jgi:hypothetical protein
VCNPGNSRSECSLAITYVPVELDVKILLVYKLLFRVFRLEYAKIVLTVLNLAMFVILVKFRPDVVVFGNIYGAPRKVPNMD